MLSDSHKTQNARWGMYKHMLTYFGKKRTNQQPSNKKKYAMDVEILITIGFGSVSEIIGATNEQRKALASLTCKIEYENVSAVEQLFSEKSGMFVVRYEEVHTLNLLIQNTGN